MVRSAAQIAALLAAALASSVGAGADPHRDWLERPRLTGDWGGHRAALRERGVELHARYAGGFWSNLRGGFETGTRYEGFAAFGADLDLERLVGWRGARFHFDCHHDHGGRPSQALVGPFGTHDVSNLEREDGFRFFEIFLEQTLFDERLRMKAGQLALDQEFMLSRYAAVFLNSAYGDFFSSLATGDFAVYPLAVPGVFAELELTEHERIRAGLYSSDTGEDEGDNIGFDWSISRNRGATIASELATQRRPFGRPATYTLGALADTGDVRDFENGGTTDGFFVVYAMIEQALVLGPGGGADVEPRLGGFLRLAASPQDDRAAVRWRLDGGLVLARPLPGRPGDVLGLGLSFNDFGRDYRRSQRAAGRRVTSAEWLFELTYRMELTGWLTLQPDLQYLVDPNLSRSNALVLGLRAVIEL